jgi:glycosyltransferase involved in cell wall biosynthesis
MSPPEAMDLASTNDTNRRRVLIISYYWVPSGGITVQRILKFTKYLRDYDWEPVMFTAKGAHYPSIDHSNEKDVPEGLEVIRQPIWEPYTIYKKFMGKPADENVNNVFIVDEKKSDWRHDLAVWVRSNFFIPDARAGWIRGSVKFLVNYLKDHPVDAIFSSGPPHTNNRIATLVSQKTGIPWLASFQDPWTQVDYFKSLPLTSWGRRRHERYERAVFEQARKIVIVSPSWARDLEAIGAPEVGVLTNGFDPEDFDVASRQLDKSFTITHIGVMGRDRHPQNLFAAIALLKETVPGFAEHCRLQLYGQVGYRIKESIEAHGLRDQLVDGGNVPRAEALRLVMNSQLLLLLLNQQDNARGRIPGKLFEYLAAKRPILCFGETDSDVAGIIRETASGETLSYGAPAEEVAASLRLAYGRFLAGDDFEPNLEAVNAFAYPRLTEKLAEMLNGITKKETSR